MTTASPVPAVNLDGLEQEAEIPPLRFRLLRKSESQRVREQDARITLFDI